MPGNNPQKNEVQVIGDGAVFVQRNGPGPNNALLYPGPGSQYVYVAGQTIAKAGNITPVYVMNAGGLKGSYRQVARLRDAPALTKAELHLQRKHGTLPFQFASDCFLNLYTLLSNCADLSNPVTGWDDMVIVSSYGIPGELKLGDSTAWDKPAMIEDVLPLTLSSQYIVSQVDLKAAAGNVTTGLTTVLADLTYGCNPSCGDCGAAINDGTAWILGITNGGTDSFSATVAPRLLYSTDNGVTFTNIAIGGTPAIVTAQAIQIIGNRFVILGKNVTSSAFYTGTLSNAGVPATPSVVTSGFDAAHDTNDFVVLSAREIVLVGAGGYIWRSTNVLSGITSVVSPGTTTTSALQHVAARGNTVVAVGNAGAVVYSRDRGNTWNLATVPSAITLTGVSVIDDYKWWVTGQTGLVYYTSDGGVTWTSVVIPGLPTTGPAWRVAFATDEVGWVLGNGVLAHTFDGGANWGISGYRLQNVPTYGQGQALAVPQCSDPAIAANNVAFGGLNTGANATAIYIGRPNIV